jgi:hypothetical protein
MATLYISEYPPGIHNSSQLASEPRLVAQTVSITAGSLQSAAFGPSTGKIRVNVDAICSFRIGPNPTAVTTEGRIPADGTEYFEVNPGDKIAVIANT